MLLKSSKRLLKAWWIIFKLFYHRGHRGFAESAEFCAENTEKKTIMIDKDLILENELATRVIGIAIDVHSQLGPGLLENAYKQGLAFKLKNEGLSIEV